MVKRTRQDIISDLDRYTRQGALALNKAGLSHAADESDRGAVVILGSHLEDVLADEILKKFPPIDGAMKNELTRMGSPLGSVAHKIKLGRALGILDADDAVMLSTIAKIRNACAHSRQHIDFNTPELRDVVCLLFDERIGHFPKSEDGRRIVRGLFIGALGYLWSRIIGEQPKLDLAGITDEALSFVTGGTRPSPDTQPTQHPPEGSLPDPKDTSR